MKSFWKDNTLSIFTILLEIFTTDPLQALEMIKVNPDQFDLVITDMTMPKITGDRLSQEILKFQQSMPIILCTGYSDRVSEDSAKDLGFAKYLPKPLDMQTLAVAVREVLGFQKS